LTIPPSGEQYELRYEQQRATVVEIGGGMREYSGVLLGYGLDEMCTAARGQVLMPWPNRIPEGRYVFDGKAHRLPLTEPEQGNAIHGLVRWASWHAVDRDAARVVMEHVLHPQPGYPFTLRLQVEYRLDTDGLTVHTSAENIGRDACPFGAGHHPYIVGAPLVDDLVLDGEPIGAKRLDDTAAKGGGWRIRAGDVTVWADDAWPYVQIFTGDLPDVGRRGLAVEPMTCPPNAFNTGEGLIRLEPGERFDGRWGITVAS
jgi:aldose 1-epimerase